MCFATWHVAKDCHTKGISSENCNRRQHKALCPYDGNESTNKKKSESVSPRECWTGKIKKKKKITHCTPFGELNPKIKFTLLF